MPWARRLGHLDRAALASLYASADICVLPSRRDARGLSALECMASGLPVIAADAGGYREIVTHGANGFLAPPDDPRAFGARIIELALHTAQRMRMGVCARQAAVAHDEHAEDARLLRQYAVVAGHEVGDAGAPQGPRDGDRP